MFKPIFKKAMINSKKFQNS